MDVEKLRGGDRKEWLRAIDAIRRSEPVRGVSVCPKIIDGASFATLDINVSSTIVTVHCEDGVETSYPAHSFISQFFDLPHSTLMMDELNEAGWYAGDDGVLRKRQQRPEPGINAKILSAVNKLQDDVAKILEQIKV